MVVAPKTIPVKFSFSNLSHTYDGNKKSATLTLDPTNADVTTSLVVGPNADTYTVTASANAPYTGSSSAKLTIKKAGQSISFPNPGPQVYGFPVTLSTSASSGLSVGLQIVSGPATISGNVVTPTGQGNVTVRASQGGNSNYNAAASVDNTFVFNNTSPTNVTLALSGAALVSGANGETAIYLGDSLTVSGSIHDADGNLTVHNLTASSDGAQTWSPLPGTDSAPTNRTDSSKSIVFTPSQNGRWDFNCNGTDGLIWPTGVSKTLWVYGRANNAVLVGYSVNGVANPSTVSVARGQRVPVSITLRNTENRPWTTDVHPHKLVAKLTGWGADTVALPANTTVFPGQELTLSFNVTVPSSVGTYAQQWQLAEYFNGSPTPFGATVPVSFVVNTVPAVSITASPATIAFGQSTTVSATATDADANLAFHGILALNQAGDNRYRSSSTDHSTGWGNHPTSTDFVSASYTSGAASGGSSTRSVVHRPSWVGTLTYHSNAKDPYGWANPSGYVTITVAKATPSATFAARPLNPGNSASYAVVAGDLNAAFSNPYSTAVAVPTGAITYTVVACAACPSEVGRTITAGSTLIAGAGYTIRASYSGDGHYNAKTIDAVLTVSKGTQSGVTSADGSITYGSGFTAPASGGSGTGSYRWEIVSGGTATGGAINSTTGAVSYTSAGTVKFRVRRLGDAKWNDSNWSPGYTLTISKASVSTSISISSVPPQTSLSGQQNLAVTATLSGTVAPTSGNVTFTLRDASGSVLGTSAGAVVNGVATGSIPIPSNIPIGTGYRVTATYDGGNSTNYIWTSSTNGGATFAFLPDPVVRDGLRVWYRSDFGVAAEASGKVSAWLDASGNDFDLYQENALLQPLCLPDALAGKTILNFEGGEYLATDSFDLNNGSDDLTVTVVFDSAATQPAHASLLAQGAAAQKGFAVKQKDSETNSFILNSWDAGGTTAQGANAPVQAGGDWRVVTFIKDGALQLAYLDGTEVGSDLVADTLNQPVASLTLGGNTVAGSAAFWGNVAEVMVFNRALGEADRKDVEASIGRRYGLLDSDGDGLNDAWEMANFGTLARDGTGDWDGDGLSDRAEYLQGTSPRNRDTDGDGFSDGYEIAHGRDPKVANQVPLPAGCQLVLRLPGDVYRGVETTDWTLSGEVTP